MPSGSASVFGDVSVQGSAAGSFVVTLFGGEPSQCSFHEEHPDPECSSFRSGKSNAFQSLGSGERIRFNRLTAGRYVLALHGEDGVFLGRREAALAARTAPEESFKLRRVDVTLSRFDFKVMGLNLKADSLAPIQVTLDERCSYPTDAFYTERSCASCHTGMPAIHLRQ